MREQAGDVAAGILKLREYVVVMLHIPELVMINMYSYTGFH